MSSPPTNNSNAVAADQFSSIHSDIMETIEKVNRTERKRSQLLGDTPPENDPPPVRPL